MQWKRLKTEEIIWKNVAGACPRIGMMDQTYCG